MNAYYTNILSKNTKKLCKIVIPKEIQKFFIHELIHRQSTYPVPVAPLKSNYF